MNESKRDNTNDANPNTDSVANQVPADGNDAVVNVEIKPEFVDQEYRLRWRVINAIDQLRKEIEKYLNFIDDDPQGQEWYLNVRFIEEVEDLWFLYSDAFDWGNQLEESDPWNEYDDEDETVGIGGVQSPSVPAND